MFSAAFRGCLFGASLSLLISACSGTEFTGVADAGSSGSSSGGSSSGGDGATGGAGNGGTGNGGSSAGRDASGGAVGGEGGFGGAGGSAGKGGAAGDGGSAGDAGSAGNGGSAAGGSAGNAGAGGALSDAGADACTLRTWFEDGDRDGAGRSSTAYESCEAPASEGWAEHGGDCNDDNEDVFPAQADYFSTPYTTAANTESFDYNCKSGEEPDPSQFGPAPTCPPTVAGCAAKGSGYVPTQRDGAGLNSICGSTTLRTCEVDTVLGCKAVETMVAPKRCR